jgi:hypothetical protein
MTASSSPAAAVTSEHRRQRGDLQPCHEHLVPRSEHEACALDYHTATLLADGRVLVTGGCCDERQAAPLASAEIYNPATNIWSPAPNMSVPRYDHTATPLADGRVLVTGGCCTTASAEIFSPNLSPGARRVSQTITVTQKPPATATFNTTFPVAATASSRCP